MCFASGDEWLRNFELGIDRFYAALSPMHLMKCGMLYDRLSDKKIENKICR